MKAKTKPTCPFCGAEVVVLPAWKMFYVMCGAHINCPVLWQTKYYKTEAAALRAAEWKGKR